MKELIKPRCECNIPPGLARAGMLMIRNKGIKESVPFELFSTK
jgi:hypothetical protein